VPPRWFGDGRPACSAGPARADACAPRAQAKPSTRVERCVLDRGGRASTPKSPSEILKEGSGVPGWYGYAVRGLPIAWACSSDDVGPRGVSGAGRAGTVAERGDPALTYDAEVSVAVE
jgi:hypothetical protein